MGKASVVEAAKRFDGPFITKHNQGGKGLGIQLFRSQEAWSDTYIAMPSMQDPMGNHSPEYIDSPNPYITRVELIGDRFLCNAEQYGTRLPIMPVGCLPDSG